jgi:hypothetical protein
MGKIKILYIRERSDPFLSTLIEQLQFDKYHIFILDLKNNLLIDKNKNQCNKIHSTSNTKFLLINYLLRFLRGLNFIFKTKKTKFDVVHILNVKRENFWLIPILKKRCKSLYISVYGKSTFAVTKRILFKTVFKHVDLFLFSNTSLMKGFKQVYTRVPSSKLINLTLPLNALTQSDKISDGSVNNFYEKYDLTQNLLNISCSSTIASYDQHFKIIDSLAKLKITDNIQLLFLLTYGGSNDQKTKIIQYIEEKLPHFKKIVFSNYLDNKELKIYRTLTDVYINMRTTDQLAGAIIESLSNEALLISGDWLDYGTLDDLDVFYTKINNFEELTEIIQNIEYEFQNFKSVYAKNNKQKVIDFFSTEKVMQRYHEIYSKK